MSTPVHTLFDDDEFQRDMQSLGVSDTRNPSSKFTQSDNLPVISDDEFQADLARLQGGTDDRWEVTKGISSGIDSLQATGGGVMALAGDAIDSDAVRNAGMDIYNRNIEEAQENAPRITDYHDIRTDGVGNFVEDATDYAVGGIGQMLPSVATMIGTGGIGGLAAKKIAQKVVKDKFGNKAKAVALKKAQQKGQVAGAATGSIGMETGEIYGDVAEQGAEGSEAIIPSLIGGTAAGALDVLPVLNVAKKFGFGGDFAEHLQKRYGDMGRTQRMGEMGVKTGLQEAGTEAAQTFIEEATKSFILERELPEDISHELINSALLGFVGGGTLGGAAGIAKPKGPIEKAADKGQAGTSNVPFESPEADTNDNQAPNLNRTYQDEQPVDIGNGNQPLPTNIDDSDLSHEADINNVSHAAQPDSSQRKEAPLYEAGQSVLFTHRGGELLDGQIIRSNKNGTMALVKMNKSGHTGWVKADKLQPKPEAQMDEMTEFDPTAGDQPAFRSKATAMKQAEFKAGTHEIQRVAPNRYVLTPVQPELPKTGEVSQASAQVEGNAQPQQNITVLNEQDPSLAVGATGKQPTTEMVKKAGHVGVQNDSTVVENTASDLADKESYAYSRSQPLNDIQQHARALGVDLNVQERDDSISLGKMVSSQPNQGYGSQVMKSLIDYADQTGKTIALTADGDFGGNKSRQIKFYKQFGFNLNRGKHKDFRFTENMLRQPNVAFSKTNTAVGQNIDSLRSELTREFGSNAKFRLVQSQSELPGKHEGRVSGMSRLGKIYLVADNVAPGKAKDVFLHEVVHTKLEKQSFYQNILSDIETSDKPAVVKAREYAKQANTRPEDVGKETIAYLVENAKDVGFIKRFITRIKAWFKKHFNLGQLNDKDLRVLVRGLINETKAGNSALTNAVDVGSRPIKIIDNLDGEQAAHPYTPAASSLKVDKDEASVQYSKVSDMTNRLTKIVNNDTGIVNYLKNKAEDWRPQWLGALTLRQLADIGKAYLPQVEGYVNLNTLMQTERNTVTDEANQQAETWRQFAVKNKVQAKHLAELMHDSTMASIDPSKDYQALVNIKGLQSTLVGLRKRLNKTFGDERTQLKSEIQSIQTQLSNARDRKTSYPSLRRRYERLPKDAQKLFKDIRDSYQKQSERTLKALEERIQETSLSQKHKENALLELRAQFEKVRLEGPYFPLARFGDYWVSAKNTDGDNEFFLLETKRDLNKSINELKRQGYTITKQGRKLDNVKAADGLPGGFMAELAEVLNDGGISNVDPLMDDIYQLYLKTLPDVSTRSHFIHRKKTKGFSDDALRAYANHMTHSAIQTARLKYGGKLELTLQEMKDKVKQSKDSTKAGALLNEIQKRHQWVMNPTNSKLAQKASSVGFAWYLGLTPAAALVNLTQNAIVAMPVLGSQFGLGKAFTKMNSVLTEFVKAKGDFNNQLDGLRLLAFKEMQKTGAIDLSMSHNLAGLGDTDTLNYDPKTHKVMTGISYLFHKAEVLNRAVTGMTAYDLHYAKHKNHKAAIEYAEKAIWESHFEYANFNRARFMQSDAAKVLLMFRQYSQNMTYYLWRNFYQSFKGESQEIQQEARKKLLGTMAVSSVMSGALGLPMVTTGLAVANAMQAVFGDDDEPFDAEVELKNFFSDYLGKTGAELILNGAVNSLTGASIADRVKLNDLWFRPPNRELEGRDLYHYYLEQIAGPIGGIALNGMRGMQLVNEGNLKRGIETMLPKAIKDAAKALRYHEEGVQNLKGNPIVADTSAYDELIQALGFTPAKVAQQYDKNNALKNYEAHILKRRSFLLAQYAIATKMGNLIQRRKVIQKMRAFSHKYPELNITAKTLKRSLKSRQSRSNEMQHGMHFNQKLQQRLLNDVSFAS